jgi:hypothetical protein
VTQSRPITVPVAVADCAAGVRFNHRLTRPDPDRIHCLIGPASSAGRSTRRRTCTRRSPRLANGMSASTSPRTAAVRCSPRDNGSLHDALAALTSSPVGTACDHLGDPPCDLILRLWPPLAATSCQAAALVEAHLRAAPWRERDPTPCDTGWVVSGARGGRLREPAPPTGGRRPTSRPVHARGDRLSQEVKTPPPVVVRVRGSRVHAVAVPSDTSPLALGRGSDRPQCAQVRLTSGRAARATSSLRVTGRSGRPA